MQWGEQSNKKQNFDGVRVSYLHQEFGFITPQVRIVALYIQYLLCSLAQKRFSIFTKQRGTLVKKHKKYRGTYREQTDSPHSVRETCAEDCKVRSSNNWCVTVEQQLVCCSSQVQQRSKSTNVRVARVEIKPQFCVVDFLFGSNLYAL